MNWQDIILIIIGVVVALLIIRYIIRMIRGKEDAKCSGCDNKECLKRDKK